MGNSPDHTQQPKNYILNPQYGGQVILSQVTGTVYQCLLLDEKSLSSFQKLLQKRKKLRHPNLLTVIGSFSKTLTSDSFTCGNETKTQMYIEYTYLTRTLQDVMEEYSNRQMDIPQKIIVQIFKTVVDVLYYLKINQTCHGDVKSSNLLFDHMGSVKLVDSYFVSGGKTSYQIVMQNPSSMSLLSPEQLDRIKNKQFQDLSTVYQSQMFSVGLTMLQAMTFQTAMQCYDLNKLILKPGYLQQKEKELRQSIYSPKLINLVMRCLSIDPEERPLHEQFLKMAKYL